MPPNPPHLLLVDDDDGFRELVRHRLRLLGCSCVAVGSVPDAIDAMEREQFDAILSDYSMPGPSGLDLLAYAHYRRPDVAFVLMSGLLDEGLRAAALAGGASAALVKSDVLDSVERLLSHPSVLAA